MPEIDLNDVTTIIEWGVRYSNGTVGIEGTGPDRERWARIEARYPGDKVLRRTVTYGPWEEVPDGT
jgi:hypothetical protein